MRRLLPLVISLVFISGCASTGTQNDLSGKASPWQKKISACMAAAKKSEWLAMEVPAANNFISNKMSALAIEMSGSTSVDALVEILSQPSRSAVAVFGENDEVTAVTLKTALRKLPSGSNRAGQQLCFVGDLEYGVQLKPVAESAGFHFLMVSNP